MDVSDNNGEGDSSGAAVLTVTGGVALPILGGLGASVLALAVSAMGMARIRRR